MVKFILLILKGSSNNEYWTRNNEFWRLGNVIIQLQNSLFLVLLIYRNRYCFEFLKPPSNIQITLPFPIPYQPIIEPFATSISWISLNSIDANVIFRRKNLLLSLKKYNCCNRSFRCCNRTIQYWKWSFSCKNWE